MLRQGERREVGCAVGVDLLAHGNRVADRDRAVVADGCHGELAQGAMKCGNPMFITA
jgi:hypothetical protein